VERSVEQKLMLLCEGLDPSAVFSPNVDETKMSRPRKTLWRQFMFYMTGTGPMPNRCAGAAQS
jgi:hypothetical protein